MKQSKALFYSGLIILFFFGCQQSKDADEKSTLGTISFDVTSNEGAVDAFEKGVLLLHSFMYSDAAFEFRKAQELDPDFAMAYWGEAMTYNHPLWSEQDYEKANEVLNQLGTTAEERLAKASSNFEKDLFQAAEILYGEGTKFERDDQYSEYLGELYNKYPDNHEVAAFYALSLLGSVEEGRDYEVYGKGAKIVEGILKENPQHPGALHYLIHSYDDPEHASLALEAANNYSQVAPDAGHALHMPSHIYVAMGMWDDVISSNIRSFDARLKRVEANKSSSWNLHAYSWLMYGYLQKGDTENVEKIIAKMKEYVGDKGYNTYTKSYVIEMVGNYLAETNKWNADIPSFDFEVDKMNVQFATGKLFIEGYMAYINGDQEGLQYAITEVDERIATAANDLVTKGITSCATTGFASRSANQNDIDIAKVMQLQLQIAKEQMEDGSKDRIEELMIAATDLESKVSFSFGPPTIVIPSYEMYGRWLLEQERYGDAVKQFDRSLLKGPGRRNALAGKLEAAKGLDDQKLIQEIESKLAAQSS